MTNFAARRLSGGAIDTLWCLFLHGPTWDGNIPSKVGRNELVDLGLAARHNGWQWLTENGAVTCIDIGYGDRKDRWEQEQINRRRAGP